jgi:hypothetical protein
MFLESNVGLAHIFPKLRRNAEFVSSLPPVIKFMIPAMVTLL